MESLDTAVSLSFDQKVILYQFNDDDVDFKCA
jgi:hypothetical protein